MATRVSLGRERAEDRAAAQRWARTLLTRSDWLILDTETTGLDGTAEVIQLAALAPDGAVLLDVLVRPLGVIPVEAVVIHGITESDVRQAPFYPDIHGRLARLLRRKTIVSYNADFDRRMLQQTAAAYGLPSLGARWECAMVQYARFVGEWNDWRGDYKWQKLPALSDSRAHTALGDCKATLALIHVMALGKGEP